MRGQKGTKETMEQKNNGRVKGNETMGGWKGTKETMGGRKRMKEWNQYTISNAIKCITLNANKY
jgi:hypothetical protein